MYRRLASTASARRRSFWPPDASSPETPLLDDTTTIGLEMSCRLCLLKFHHGVIMTRGYYTVPSGALHRRRHSVTRYECISLIGALGCTDKAEGLKPFPQPWCSAGVKEILRPPAGLSMPQSSPSVVGLTSSSALSVHWHAPTSHSFCGASVLAFSDSKVA
jgi:hypothetical protein